MKEADYKVWLSGGYGKPTIATNLSYLRRFEKAMFNLGLPYSDLDALFEARSPAEVTNIIDDIVDDYEAEGQRYKVLVPKGEKPKKSLANFKTYLGQYGRFWAGESAPQKVRAWPELEAFKAEFLKRCPDFKNFSQTHGEYYLHERKYKDALGQRVMEIAASSLPDNEAGEQMLKLLAQPSDIVQAGLPFSWRAWSDIQTAPDDVSTRFFELLGALARSPQETREALITATDGLLELRNEGHTFITRGVILSSTFCVLTCIRPSEVCFAKSSFVNSVGKALTGMPLLSGHDFKLYQALDFLEIMTQTFQIMEEEWGWAPRDLQDAQGFAWVVLQWEDEEMVLSNGLTRAAVREAMVECDERGEHEFLSHYNFGNTHRYRVRDGGQDYPSKAIASVAFKFTPFGEVNRKIHGGVWGEGNAGSLLRELGFEIIDMQDGGRVVTDAQNVTHPLNQILYGPPGTGKTYNTAKMAVEICDGSAPEDRGALMARYEELRDAGRIGFTTFHQSMGYEEFVEGLRPVTAEDSDSTGFHLEPTPGIFRRMCSAARAKKGTQSGAGTMDLSGRRFFKMSLGGKGVEEHIYQACLKENCLAFGYGGDFDWSGSEYDTRDGIKSEWQKIISDAKDTDTNITQTNTFRNHLRQGDVVVISEGNLLFRAIGIVTGDYQYVDRETGDDEFISGDDYYCHRRSVRWAWIAPKGESRPTEDIYAKTFSQVTIYQLKKDMLDLALIKELISFEDEKPENYVLIIDEINRANVSKIFGELITLVEDDKREDAKNSISVTLPYSGNVFSVPQNLFLIGTMNTADRSIALLDTALRRRFDFREMMPDYTLDEIDRTVDGVHIGKFLESLNTRIEWLFDRDHQIGHSYFMKADTLADLDDIMRNRIIPLLSEYFYEDWEKVRAVLNDKDQQFIRVETLSPVEMLDDQGETRHRYSVLPGPFSIVAYQAAYR